MMKKLQNWDNWLKLRFTCNIRYPNVKTMASDNIKWNDTKNYLTDDSQKFTNQAYLTVSKNLQH